MGKGDEAGAWYLYPQAEKILVASGSEYALTLGFFMRL